MLNLKSFRELVSVSAITAALSVGYADDPPAPPQAASPFAQGTDDLTVPDVSVIHTFKFGPVECRIFAGSSNILDAKRGEDLSRMQLYLMPLAEVPLTQFQQTVATATRDAADDQVVHVVLPEVVLLSRERAEAAAASMNTHFRLEGSDRISPSQFFLYPIKRLNVFANVGGQEQLASSSSHSQNVPTVSRFEVSASKRALLEFSHDPRVRVEISVQGFSVARNSYQAIYHKLLDDRFRHILEGDGSFQTEASTYTVDLSKADSRDQYSSTKASSASTIVQRMRSAVTRRQLASVLSEAIDEVRVEYWNEFDDVDLPELKKKIFDEVLARAQETTKSIETRVLAGDKISIELVGRDISPDVLAEIGAVTSTKNAMHGKSEKKSIIEHGSKADQPPKSENTSSEELKSSAEVEFDTRSVPGAPSSVVVVPKSVKLYTLRKADIAALAKTSVQSNRALIVTRQLTSPIVYVSRECKSFVHPLLHSRRVNGTQLQLTHGDACLGIADGEKAHVRFELATSFTSDEISVKANLLIREIGDLSTIEGAEQLSFSPPDNWRVTRLLSQPNLVVEVQGKLNILKEDTRLELGQPLVRQREVNANTISLFPDGDRLAMILSNPDNLQGRGQTRPYGFVAAPHTPVKSLVLRVDTSDSGGKPDVVLSQVGYDFSLEVEYLAERFIYATSPLALN